MTVGPTARQARIPVEEVVERYLKELGRPETFTELSYYFTRVGKHILIQDRIIGSVEILGA